MPSPFKIYSSSFKRNVLIYCLFFYKTIRCQFKKKKITAIFVFPNVRVKNTFYDVSSILHRKISTAFKKINAVYNSFFWQIYYYHCVFIRFVFRKKYFKVHLHAYMYMHPSYMFEVICLETCFFIDISDFIEAFWFYKSSTTRKLWLLKFWYILQS